MIGELFDTGVVSAIKDWKIVMESIMATPRRENSWNPCHVKRSKRTSWRDRKLVCGGAACERRRKKFLPLENEGAGGAVVPFWQNWNWNETKESWRTEENVHTPWLGCQVTYQRTITGDRNYFGHRVQEYCERKENCNAWKSIFHFPSNSFNSHLKRIHEKS